MRPRSVGQTTPARPNAPKHNTARLTIVRANDDSSLSFRGHSAHLGPISRLSSCVVRRASCASFPLSCGPALLPSFAPPCAVLCLLSSTACLVARHSRPRARRAPLASLLDTSHFTLHTWHLTLPTSPLQLLAAMVFQPYSLVNTKVKSIRCVAYSVNPGRKE